MASKLSIFLKYAGVIAFGILVGVLLTNIYLSIIVPGNKVSKGKSIMEPMVQALAELRQLDAKLNSIKSLKAKEREIEIILLKKDFERIKEQILNTKEIETYRAKLVEENVLRADEIINMTNFLITIIVFIFGIFVATVGQLTFKRHAELKTDLDKQIDRGISISKEIDEQKRLIEEQKKDLTKMHTDFKKQIGDQSENLGKVLEKFRVEVQEQKNSIDDTGNFIRALADEFFSATIIGLLSSLAQSNVITDAEDRTLRDMIAESEYLLFLKHPEKAERQRAIYGLRGLGTDRTIPALENVVNNVNEDEDLRKLAQRVINEIKIRTTDNQSEDS